MNIYSTFYRPNKPQGIEQRKAYIVGGGIAGLAAAVFLIDDAGMPGKNITIYEKRRDTGGCCGVIGTEGAYICPGERELEPYMECLWYLCSKIPSLDTPGRTVLDETVDVNRESAIHSECRCLVKQGHIWQDVHDYRMDPETAARLAGTTAVWYMASFAVPPPGGSECAGKLGMYYTTPCPPGAIGA